MPSAPEFHPYVGYLGGSKRRGTSTRLLFAATIIGAVAGAATVVALIPRPGTGAHTAAPTTTATLASVDRTTEPAKVPTTAPIAMQEPAARTEGSRNTAVRNTAAPVPAVAIEASSATSRAEKPCAEQTWPYLDRKCLTRSETRNKARGVRVVAPDAPANTTELAGGPAELATDGALVETASVGVPVPRPRPEAEAVLGTKQAAPSADEPQGRVRSADADEEIEKRAEQRRSSASRKKKARSQLATRSRRFDAEARGRTLEDDQEDSRAGRRWNEREYTFPDGRRQRVIVVHRGGFPREAYRDRYSRDAYPPPYYRGAYARESYFGGFQ